ncbi:hypothetical protein [Streptomyces sp. NPDC059278]|uniref:hypothetical protein n=1 Tax=Streptomyces sp. NPDC059278 TaxID=3346801 RepID=UPI0036C7CC96
MKKKSGELNPEKVLYALEKEVRKRRAWDEPPEFGFIFASEKGTGTLPIPVPGKMWIDAGHPKNVLYALRDAFRKPLSTEAGQAFSNLRAAAPPDMVGLYLRNEGWAPRKGTEGEMYRRRMAGGSTPNFKEMEGRVEVRVTTAVDKRGRVYMVQQERGGPVEGYCDTKAEQGTCEVGGDVPKVLVELMMEFRPPADRT